MTRSAALDPRLKATVAIVALLNLAYFGVEMAVALAIDSVALFADSVDFLEDASVNLLVLVGIGMAAGWRRALGIVLAALILLPAITALWTVWLKLSVPTVPDPTAITATAIGALIVNSACALLLARVHSDGSSLMTAAFLSARNDMMANIAVIGAGIATAIHPSIWPDIVVGVAIAALNASAAREVYEAALVETDAPRA